MTLEADTAVLNHDGLKTISLPVSELLTVLDQIARDAQQMEVYLTPKVPKPTGNCVDSAPWKSPRRPV